MKHINTQAIILSRTNYGEADRIVSFLTPDQGKLRGLVRGARKQKSKLAGGLELFSISEISYLVGRGEMYTVTSTRLLKHFGNIVKDIDRTNAAYDFIKTLNKATEDNLEKAYFELLKAAFESLDDKKINLELIQLWFKAQLLKLAGQTPNLQTDGVGNKLKADKKYNFDFEAMNFSQPGTGRGRFGAPEIKFLRLIFSNHTPKSLQKVQGFEKLTTACRPLVSSQI